MSEPECRHLPTPVWNPVRCGRCGATLPLTPGPDAARLLAAAKAFFHAWQGGGFGCHLIAPQIVAAIAEHEAAPQPAQPKPSQSVRPLWTDML